MAQETKIDTLKFMEAKMSKITCICLGVRSMQKGAEILSRRPRLQDGLQRGQPARVLFQYAWDQM